MLKRGTGCANSRARHGRSAPLCRTLPGEHAPIPTEPTQLIDTSTHADIAAARAEAAAADDAPALRAAEHAERVVFAANEGRLEDARRELALALAETNDPRLLFLGFQFCFRAALEEGVSADARAAGLEEAERLVRRRLRIAEAAGDTPHLGRAHTNLGLVLQYKGEAWSAEAEVHYQRAIQADRRLGHEQGIARDLGNLGNFYDSRGAPERAEPLHREALEIARRIGAPKIAAVQLANLGDIAAGRGQMPQARALWTEAAEIFRTQKIEKSVRALERKLSEAD